MISVSITETTVYRSSYERNDLVTLCLNTPGFPLGEAELAGLTDGELARLVWDEMPLKVREDLTRHGDVTDSWWQTAYSKPGELGLIVASSPTWEPSWRPPTV